MTPLDPRYIDMRREVGRYVTAVLSIALLIGALGLFLPRRWYFWLPLWIVGTAVLAWLSYRWPAIAYRYMGYRIDEDGIEIASGVFWRAIANVPRTRVQHTDVAQGPIERKYGLGRLIIYTAGTAHSRVELPGLPHETALALRDRLLPRHSPDVV